VAGVRRRAPVAATVVAAASIVAFAGVAAARLLQQRGQTWASSAGTVAIRGDSSPLPAASVRQGRDGRPTPVASLATAAARFDSGDALGTLQTLVSLQLPDSGSERFAADSLIAVAAVRATEKALSARVPSLDALQLIIVTTTGAIGRAHPGTSIMATLSLARAGACIGGRLSCPPDQVREDLAWTVILGTPTEQDQARRLRAALVGDTLVTQ
jgi:hypothetical protein